MSGVEHGARRGRNGLVATIVAVSTERVRRRIEVSGRVQGVSFRYYASERAQAHGVAGWVRNCSDGTVEAVLEGEPDAVERVVRFFRTGPPHARVEDVRIADEAPEGLSGFYVR
jgi:acylphosphatase